jgi:phage terminase small subunit
MPKGKQLTDQQKVFVEEYLASWNATEAYQRAHPKCTRRTARENGSKSLTNTNIRAAVSERLQEKAMDANEVLARLADMARSDMSDYIDIVDGKAILNLAKAKEDGKLHLVKSISPTAHGLRVELHDAQTALEKIGKYHKLFTESVDVTSKGESIAPKEDDAERFDRAILTLSDALRKALPGDGPEQDGSMGASKPATVAGASKQGR